MVKISSVAVGSVPLALQHAFQSGTLAASETVCRLQLTDLRQNITMFSEFAALADGRSVAHASPDAGRRVRKAQVIGPVTLLSSETETLQTSIRRIRAALDTLLDLHPDLDELWLDEPLLGKAPTDWARLLGNAIRALKSEYLDIRIGVHSCGPIKQLDLSAIDADAWAFDLDRYWDDILPLWRSQRPEAELIWSVIPTTGEAPQHRTAEELLALHQELQPERPMRITTACGLGTRSEDVVRAVLTHQDALLAALRSAAGSH